MRLKINLLILTILCTSIVNAQYDEWTPAKVVFKNGISYRGLVKFPKHSGGLISMGTTKFKYRKNKKSKTLKHGHETVQEIIFGDERFETVHYKYVPIKKNKFVLMELMVSGKASLYSRTVLRFQDTGFGTGNLEGSGYYYDDTQYYLIRKNESVAKLVSSPDIFGSFNLSIKKYFTDCEILLDYINDELYSYDNLIELVNDYNLLCD